MLNPELYIVYNYPEQRAITFEYGIFFLRFSINVEIPDRLQEFKLFFKKL